MVDIEVLTIMMVSSNGNIFHVPSLCEVNPPMSLYVFFHMRLSKRLSRQSRNRWFYTPPRLLRSPCNDPCIGLVDMSNQHGMQGVICSLFNFKTKIMSRPACNMSSLHGHTYWKGNPLNDLFVSGFTRGCHFEAILTIFRFLWQRELSS